MAFVAGQKVRASDLNETAGLKAWGKRTSHSAGTAATSQATAQKVMEISCAVTAGRQYRVFLPQFGTWSSADGRSECALTYTTNGTTPAVTSPILVKICTEFPAGGIPLPTPFETIYTPATSHTLRLLLTIFRVSGTANIQTYGDATVWPLILAVEDIGPAVSAAQTLF